MLPFCFVSLIAIIKVIKIIMQDEGDGLFDFVVNVTIIWLKDILKYPSQFFKGNIYKCFLLFS